MVALGGIPLCFERTSGEEPSLDRFAARTSANLRRRFAAPSLRMPRHVFTTCLGAALFGPPRRPAAPAASRASQNQRANFHSDPRKSDKAAAAAACGAKGDGLHGAEKRAWDEKSPALSPLPGKRDNANENKVIHYPLNSPLSSKRKDIPWHPILACAANQLVSFDAMTVHVADNLSNGATKPTSYPVHMTNLSPFLWPIKCSV